MWETILTNEERAAFALRKLYLEHGYQTYKMSRFEEYDLYVRCRDFLPSERIITFPGPDGRLLALKPDVTLSVLRGAIEEPGQVQRVCYNENVYRADPSSGTFREILQTGLECVGDLTREDVGQVVWLAAKSMEALGGDWVLTISHMGLLRAVLAQSGLSAAGRQEAMDCIRRKNPHAMAALCRREQIDPALLLTLLDCTDLSGLAPICYSADARAAFDELSELLSRLSGEGFGNQIRVDFSAGQDMKYYDGVAFKGYLSGIPTSVLSGGQYDRLARLLGKRCRAVGFAVYVAQLSGAQTGGSV